MKFIKKSSIALFGSVSFICSTQLPAQSYDFGTYTLYIPPVFSQAGMDNPATWQNNNVDDNSKTEINAPAAALSYTFSLTRRSENLAAIRSRYLQNNYAAEDKAIFDQLFTPGIFSAVDAKFGAAGLSSANLGDVLAAHLLSSWQAANALPDSAIPKDNLLALAKQISQTSFANNMRTLNDEQKQKAAEELISQILVASALNERGKAYPQFKQAAQDYGRAAIKQFGIDYTRFDITAKGYVLKAK